MVLFEVINPVSVKLLIVFIVCERVPSVQFRKYIHTLFLAALVAEASKAFWQAKQISG